MDNIINYLEKRFKQLSWIENIKRVQDILKIKTKEGMEYICKTQCKGKQATIIVKEKTLNYCLENKFSNSIVEDKSIKDYIILETEAEIFKNEMCVQAFKKGIADFKKRNQIFNIDTILNKELYNKLIKTNEDISLIEFLWNKGYEFSSKYPYPDEVDKQYNYIAEKTKNISSVEEIRDFIKKNQDMYTYLDEKKIPEDITSLNEFREIEYSYKNIVAKMYIKTWRLKEKILVFDTEGIKEFANCHIEDYKDVYNSKLIEEMFKSMEMYRKTEKELNIIEEEKEEK